MSTPIPPNTPPFNGAPLRNALDDAGKVLVNAKSPWGIWFNVLYQAVIYLLMRPVSLSGLDADLPDPTLYPENSRWFSTDAVQEYIAIYSVPGDPTSATWVAM